MTEHTFERCIDVCHGCAVACHHCAASCLREQEVGQMADCVRLNLDCAQSCYFAASLMARGSLFARTFCRLCADICETCGDECAKHPVDHCQQCARACRHCAELCRRMAAEQ